MTPLPKEIDEWIADNAKSDFGENHYVPEANATESFYFMNGYVLGATEMYHKMIADNRSLAPTLLLLKSQLTSLQSQHNQEVQRYKGRIEELSLENELMKSLYERELPNDDYGKYPQDFL